METEGAFRLQEKSGPQHGRAGKQNPASHPPAIVSYEARPYPEAVPKPIVLSGRRGSVQAPGPQGGGYRTYTSDSASKETTAQARRSLGNKEESLGKASFGLRQEGLIPVNSSREERAGHLLELPIEPGLQS